MDRTPLSTLNASVSWESIDVPEYQPWIGRRPVMSRENCNCFPARFRLAVKQPKERFIMMGLGLGLVVLLIVLIVLFFVLIFIVSAYNRLVSLRNRFKNAYSQIDVQLKRRYDLIPNLVETAKGYIKHERETLEAVTQARNVAYAASQTAAANPGDPNAVKSLVSAEGGLAGALSRLMVVSERYPDLKANQNMMQLSEELTSTENKISFSRQAYNDSVMVYNTQREVFPSNLIAGAFNFGAAELFIIDKPEQKDAPKVSFP
jgi:LemA protein